MADMSAAEINSALPIAQGGKTIYGAALGILMLEARFPRIPGDMGHAGTWPFPVLYKVVRGASPERVVRQRADGLLDAFLAAADELIRDGADGITTNCGFLALFQHQLAAHCRVPVASSALLQLPLIQALLPPDRRVGIITVDSASLSQDHLAAIGLPADIPIVGTENGREFSRAILGNELTLNVALARADLLQAGQDLQRRYPEVGAVLLECTNMAPYSADLQAALRLPVFDIVSFINWFHAGLRPRRFRYPEA